MDSKRTFGVEIEHGNREGYRFVAAKVKAKFPRWTNCGEDGSGVELRSPILQGQSGLDELGEVMEYLKEIGGYVTKNDGMHVHHDASDFVGKRIPVTDADDLVVWDAIEGRYVERKTRPGHAQKAASAAVLRVLESYAENQRIIDRLVDPYRRKWAVIEKTSLDSWKKNNVIRTGRHNVHYSRHGTFEFRQFEGCLDPAKAFAWIDFGQCFLNYTHELSRPASCAATAKHLLNRIGCNANTRRALLDRPRRSQMPDGPPKGAPAPYYGDYAAVRQALGIREPYIEREV
jgi:hypothetical protein